jgi:hypothetical protein
LEVIAKADHPKLRSFHLDFHFSLVPKDMPKGHQEREEDRAIKSRAAMILDEYRRRRARYIGVSFPPRAFRFDCVFITAGNGAIDQILTLPSL